MGRFQSKEDYERWRAAQRGEAPVAAAPEALADTADAAPADQVYDGPAPGSAAFVDRSRPQAGLSTDRDRNLAMLCHLTALLGFIPFANILGPLVVWMIGKGDSQFVDEHGKSSLNFQISITLAFILAAVFGIFLGPMIVILFVVFGIVAVYALVMVIVNGVKAHNGEEGEYALSTHFLK
jgi:uncharacterized protein